MEIFYNFPDGTVTKAAQDEFNRIFQDCFKKCRCTKDTVSFTWTPTKKPCKDVKTGFFDSLLGTGFYAKSVKLCAEYNPKQNVTGYNNGYTAFVNSDKLAREASNFDLGMGVVLAHELGFHAIGGDSDWILGTPTDWNGKPEDPDSGTFVDSKKPTIRPGIQFSKQACSEICDELDVK